MDFKEPICSRVGLIRVRTNKTLFRFYFRYRERLTMFLRNLRHARTTRLWDSRTAFLADTNFYIFRMWSSDTKGDSDSQQNITATTEEPSAITEVNISLTQTTSGETSDETAAEGDQRKRELQAMSVEFIESVDEASLSPQQLAIHKAHVNALKAGEMFYKDPLTGYDVMSKLAHLHRGDCCGNACRHCPFGMKNAPEELQQKRIYNSAYYEEPAS
ncbi:hypothetical protein V1264_006677 [Littorina saxatilis]|uniref:Uncharacterized protein n=1 Tax=Littorina saxatilis TaxID=31220 RepID=A0AAN9AZY7_9CAEN